jgi:hypothetical protein
MKMMNYKDYFHVIISNLLEGKISRDEAAKKVSSEIEIDEIKDALYSNCEWALRHANESIYYTSIEEFQYLELCLNGKKTFNEKERDLFIEKKDEG